MESGARFAGKFQEHSAFSVQFDALNKAVIIRAYRDRLPEPYPAFFIPVSSATLTDRQQWRLLKDRIARHAVALGGIGVIIAIVLIFFYLLYVVVPLLRPAQAEAVASYSLPGSEADTLYLAMEEQAEVALRIASDGQATFFSIAAGHWPWGAWWSTGPAGATRNPFESVWSFRAPRTVW